MVMNTLFPDYPVTPDGFEYYPDFLNEEEEQRLINTVQGLELYPLIFQGFEAKRKVRSYGYDYHFNTRSISPGLDIPPGLIFLQEKVAAWAGLYAEDLAEVLVTEYPQGSVINWHRDAPPFDVIAGVSLLSDCRFKLRPFDKEKQGKKSVVTLPVSRRSLYIIRGDARTNWEHCTAPVSTTRYSITFRTLINGYNNSERNENSKL